MLGAVVVGVGVAGRVRIRDMLAPPPSSAAAETLSLKGFISRRVLGQQQGLQQVCEEEALSRQDVQVAFVCTENAGHEEHIRRFLEAGKHVCVEYPMTMTHAAAVALWDLAEVKGLVLHEEHIELLTADYKQLKKEIAGKTLEEGSLHFTGGPLQEGSGFPSFSGISRLTWLVDLFGELTVDSASLEEGGRGYTKMTAHLVTKQHRPLTWVEERGPGLSRTKSINFRFDTCTVTQFPPAPPPPPGAPPPPQAVGLFMQDLELFSLKLLGRTAPWEMQAERSRVLHCLDLSQSIQQLSQGGGHIEGGHIEGGGDPQTT